MPSSRHTWVPFGPAIRRIREAKGITVDAFCTAAGCIAETLERLERRHTKTLPYGRLAMYAKDILRCDLRDIGCPIDEAHIADPDLLPRAFAAEPKKPIARARAAEVTNRPFLSKLERLKLAEEKAGLSQPPPVLWGDASYSAMTALALWNIHSACGIHENELYSATGEIINQRRMNLPEQVVLQCEGGRGSRFQLLRSIPGATEPLSLTLFSNTPEHTRYLQLFIGKTVSVLVRVVLAAPDPEQGGKLSMTNPSGGKRIVCPPDWKNFFVFNTTKTTPWGLLVERVSDPVE